MKTTALAAFVWLLCGVSALSQPAWEGGLFVGGASYQGDLVESTAPDLRELTPAVGLFTRFYLRPSWSLRTDLLYATLTGDDKNFKNQYIRTKRQFSFSTQVGQVTLLLEWDPLGKHRFPGNHKMRPSFSPFFFGGTGVGYIQPMPSFGNKGGESPGPVTEDRQAASANFRVALPAGMGLRLDLGRGMSISSVLTSHYFVTDYLDGISQAGNPDTRDWMWTGGVHLTVHFQLKDTDKDGIPDKEDGCPWIAGVETAKGCPDSDGDGVEDAEDACPDLPGLFDQGGCPDSDGDGIMDLLDGCPTVFGFDETDGCPDRDNDCIADAADKCPDNAGLPQYSGCPDTDGDSIADNYDPCPLEPGLPENGGCPLPDTDCDGIVDRDDDCPLLDGGGTPSGCPDSDGDGLTDNHDRCPELPGPSETGGCPALQEEEKKLIDNAKSSIRFKTGSAILLSESKKILDDIVDIMHKYPYYHLRIEGHTDNRGDDKVNLRLSQKRAQSCYEHLLYRGIGPDRMEFQGFGEAIPVADNSTEAGRRLNRRVEFGMFIPE